MIFYKRISELSIRELKTVFVRTGRRGVFLESSAIIQLTIFLVRIGQDPFTYRFLISVPEDGNPNATVVKEADVSNFHVQYAIDGVKNVPKFECSNNPIEMADGLSANVKGTENRDIVGIETEEELAEVKQKSGYEEVLAGSSPGLADGGLSADSRIILSSESVSSSVLLSSSSETKSTFQSLLSKVFPEAFLVRYSDMSSQSSAWMVLSYRSIQCLSIVETSGTGREDEYHVKTPYSEHWPPDSVLFRFLDENLAI